MTEGKLCIYNATPYFLVPIGIKSEYMKNWDKDLKNAIIKPYDHLLLNIQFESSYIKTYNNLGKVGFILYGHLPVSVFEIQAFYHYESGTYKIEAHFPSLNVEKFLIFPPITAEEHSTYSNIGFIPQTTQCFLVCLNKVMQVSDFSLVSPLPQSFLSNWMETFKFLLKYLPLSNFTIPGTHESATYKMKSQLYSRWSCCQSLNVMAQLENGIRGLDISTGIHPELTDDEKFRVINGEYTANNSVKTILTQIRIFLWRNNQEIVYLCFHHFSGFSFGIGSQDFEEFQDMIHRCFDELIIPETQTHLSYADIIAGPGRVIVFFNKNKRSHGFSGSLARKEHKETVLENLKTTIKKEIVKRKKAKLQFTEELKSQKERIMQASQKDYISEIKQEKSGELIIDDSFWALNAILNPTTLSSVSHLFPHIDNWLYGGSDWSLNCNVIFVDYFEKTNLVIHSIISNLIKGSQSSGKICNVHEIVEKLLDPEIPQLFNIGVKFTNEKWLKF